MHGTFKSFSTSPLVPSLSSQCSWPVTGAGLSHFLYLPMTPELPPQPPSQNVPSTQLDQAARGKKFFEARVRICDWVQELRNEYPVLIIPGHRFSLVQGKLGSVSVSPSLPSSVTHMFPRGRSGAGALHSRVLESVPAPPLHTPLQSLSSVQADQSPFARKIK